MSSWEGRPTAPGVPDARLPDGGWIDLDAAPVTPPARRRPFRIVLVLAALAGVGAGGAVAALTARSLPPPSPPVVARVTLEGLVMAPAPAAVLRLTVDNRGTDHQDVREAVVSGGGTAGTTRQLGRVVSPARQAEELITVPLRCSPGLAPSGTLHVAVRLAPDARRARPATLTAVTSGRAAEVGGLCTAADTVLPAGWRTPARATSWRIVGGELDMTVTGLPAGLVRLVSVEADGVLLPQPRVAGRTGEDTMHVVVGAPTPGCRDGGLRPVVATGVQLRIDTGSGLSDVYVPLGAAVAQWFMDAYVRACPSNPAGPPAVTAGFG